MTLEVTTDKSVVTGAYPSNTAHSRRTRVRFKFDTPPLSSAGPHGANQPTWGQPDATRFMVEESGPGATRPRIDPRRNGADVHEMALTQSVVDTVCEHAAGRRVHSVLLEVGALTAVVPEAMRFCFELATEGTAADGARLDVDVRPGSARCRACDAEFELQDLILLCACGSTDVEVLAGRDLRIMSMEVS